MPNRTDLPSFESVRRYLKSHPLLVQASTDTLITNMGTPEGVHAFRLAIALGVLDPSCRWDPPGQVLEADRVLLALDMLDAVPYFWLPGPIRIALDAALPRYRLAPTALPFPSVFLVSRHPFFLTRLRSARDGSERPCLAAQLTRHGEEIWVSMFLGEPDVNETLGVTVAPVALPIGDEVGPDTVGADFLKLLAFANSAIVRVASRKMPRPRRRRLDAHPEAESAVHFVELRSELQEAGGHGDLADQAELEREFRWVVRGHYRAQWYPSFQAHELIWVDSFLKGPEGAPIRPRQYRVSR